MTGIYIGSIEVAHGLNVAILALEEVPDLCTGMEIADIGMPHVPEVAHSRPGTTGVVNHDGVEILRRKPVVQKDDGHAQMLELCHIGCPHLRGQKHDAGTLDGAQAVHLFCLVLLRIEVGDGEPVVSELVCHV